MVLDSGVLERLAREDDEATDMLEALRDGVTWPAMIPSVALAECYSGRPRTDVAIDRLVNTCRVVEQLPTSLARRAGELRRLAGRGSVVDAIVVAVAEPNGIVLTTDIEDLTALADSAKGVVVHRALPSKRRK